MSVLKPLKPLYAKLTLIGGLVLLIGIRMPWYYQSTFADGKYYEMNALGGSLVGFLEENPSQAPYPIYFDLYVSYLSVIFALLTIFFPIAYVKLVEKSQRKWMAIMSLIGGVAALANIFYVHYWLNWYYPNGELFYSDASLSRGPLLGYFLTWIAAILFFAVTYVSKGLAQMFPEKPKKNESTENSGTQ